MELVTNSYEFISFDSEETFEIKANYASEQCMRGYVWWAVDMIDKSFTIPIHSPTFSPVPSTTPMPTNYPTISAAPTTQMSTPNDPTCPAGHTGWRAYLECTHYFYCQNGVVLGVPYACPDGTLYSEELQNCDWEDNVECHSSPVTPAPIISAPITSAPKQAPTPAPTNFAPVTPVPVTPTTSMPIPNGPTCPAGHTGWKAYLECTHYFYCQNGVVLGVPYECPDGTLYNEELQNCDSEDNVECHSSPVTPAPIGSAPITSAPTEAPTPFLPTTSCVVCDDIGTKKMQNEGQSCASHKNLNEKCNIKGNWIKHKICRLSCYNAGKPYDGDLCCMEQ